MAKPLNPIVVIPARLASTRLPDKPLADIAGQPMIVHVWQRAVAAGIGPVVVACADIDILDAVKEAGGDAVFTNPDHASGSDRVFEAVSTVDPRKRHDCVVNVQGDLPTIAPEDIRAALEPLAEPRCDIATLAAKLRDAAERDNPNVVKVALALGPGESSARALSFSRRPTPVPGAGLYHHIGLYAFRRAALERFVRLPRGEREIEERLEQLRAMENGMRIDARLVDTVPLGVDTPADLARARELLQPGGR